MKNPQAQINKLMALRRKMRVKAEQLHNKNTLIIDVLHANIDRITREEHDAVEARIARRTAKSQKKLKQLEAHASTKLREDIQYDAKLLGQILTVCREHNIPATQYLSLNFTAPAPAPNVTQ